MVIMVHVGFVHLIDSSYTLSPKKSKSKDKIEIHEVDERR
jgi:hypothetical protein